MPLSRFRLADPVSFPREDDEWHSFLESGPSDTVAAALRVKRYLQSLPETAATVSSREIHENTGVSYAQLTPELMAFLGSWEVPEVFGRIHGPQKYTNPHHEYRHRFSDAVAVCQCGTPHLRERFTEEYPQPVVVSTHGEDCCPLYRRDVQARLWQNRCEIAIEMLRLGHSARATGPRLGFAVDSEHGWKVISKCGLDPKEMVLEGRRRSLRTFIVLARDYSTADIAELYGVSKAAVSRLMRTETTASPKALYSYRRRYDKAGRVLETPRDDGQSAPPQSSRS